MQKARETIGAQLFFPLSNDALHYYNLPCLLHQLLIAIPGSSIVMLSTGKRCSAKSTAVLSLAFLIGIALTVDFFWSSSSSSSSPFLSTASNWAQEKNQILVVPNPKNDAEKGEVGG